MHSDRLVDVAVDIIPWKASSTPLPLCLAFDVSKHSDTSLNFH